MAVEARVLALVEAVIGSVELDDFYSSLLAGLSEAVPSEWVSLNDIGPDAMDVTVIARPEVPADLVWVFARLRHENPLVEHYARTRDARPYRISDFLSPVEWRQRQIYLEFYRPLGIEHQIAFTLPASNRRILGVALSRADPDYSDLEREILDRARPLLVQMFRNVVAHSRLLRRTTDVAGAQAHLLRAGLSARQSEVLALLARGLTVEQIAARLAISRRTVEKHIQQAYRTLGVNSRAAALEAVAGLVDPHLGSTPGPRAT